MDIAATSNSALYSMTSASQAPMDVLSSIPAKSIQVSTSSSSTASQNNTSSNRERDSQAGRSNTISQAEKAPTEKSASSDQQVEREVQRVISELKSRDREVKAHEQAHLAAGGQHVTGGANYSYQTGPDGRRYAIGGEVGIDTSPVSGDPQATLAKAQQIRAAALAPAEPSSQDRKVAAQASQMAAEARADIMDTKQEERTEGVEDTESTNERPLSESSERDIQSNPLLSDTQNENRLEMSVSPENRLMSSAVSERNQFEIRLMNQAS
ncbi:putative metalloprotease CJM1_0395 family protein [Thiomicrospira sp. S5]|uniref:putative metalloprotease CJM1_0395 family protein n=1 Tax=Thiomicrospira sp. S5 TaxID=1803865 RepID=UPI00197CCF50|nr:putative metalloprotease CJM1_0395 family protein [Thiomicrospira sp. S5]